MTEAGTSINGSQYLQGEAAHMRRLDLHWNLMDFEHGVRKQLEKQEAKWGVQDHELTTWLAILIEEIGEVAKAIIEDKREELARELYQCGALLAQMATTNQREVDGRAAAEARAVAVPA